MFRCALIIIIDIAFLNIRLHKTEEKNRLFLVISSMNVCCISFYRNKCLLRLLCRWSNKQWLKYSARIHFKISIKFYLCLYSDRCVPSLRSALYLHSNKSKLYHFTKDNINLFDFRFLFYPFAFFSNSFQYIEIICLEFFSHWNHLLHRKIEYFKLK